jgi:U3 small nucleolar RNA-associated protein 22
MKRRRSKTATNTETKRVRLNGDSTASERLPSSKRSGGLYRPPTTDELNELKDTETLFKSNLFRMQISELLAEVGVKEKRVKQIEPVIHKIRDAITRMPHQPHDIKMSDMLQSETLFEGGICLPLLWKSFLTLKGHMSLSPPTSVRVIGSFLVKTQCKPGINVDLAVEIPKSCLYEKDCLSHTYFAKRAVYLAYVASHLSQLSDVVCGASYVIVDGDRMRPVLQLELTGKVGKFCSVRIWPALPDGIFKLSKLGPMKNSVRPAKFTSTKHAHGDDWMPPTPHYNSSVLMDLSYDRSLRLLYEACTDCLAMRDAILLLKVWMQQRELNQGFTGFSGFIISMLTAHLLRTNKLNRLMSSYQILRVVMKFLSSTDWAVKGISMADSTENSGLPSLDKFHHAFDVVFVDSSGYLNLCCNMTTHTYNNVRHEAQLALEFLDSSTVDGFGALFMMPVKFFMKFEHVFQVPVSSLHTLGKSKELLSLVLDYGGDWLKAAVQYISPLLVKGLGKRIQLLTHKLHIPTQWSVDEQYPSDSTGSLMYGLILNSDSAFSLVNKGPAADDPKAKDFRSFWGSKAELRRFQDGSVTESVFWPCKSHAEKRLICRRIASFLLKKYADIEPSSITYLASQIDSLLVPSEQRHQKGTGEEESIGVLKAFDALTNDMRRLRDLPLAIHSVQGIDPAFRETEVFPPIPWTAIQHGVHLGEKGSPLGKVIVPTQSKEKDLPPWILPLKVVCHLEGSSKWPDDLIAMQKIKAAFHLRISQLLQDKCKLTAVPTEQNVLINKHGYVFQLSVANDREILLLKNDLSMFGLEDRVLQAERLEMETIHLPLLTSTLRGLEMQYPSFSVTARLAKRWISCQLLSQHISDECVELLVAYLYLTPAPYRQPGSPLCGFLRFLSLLCNHDWTNNALMVNLNSEFTTDDYQTVPTTFSSNRSHLPAMVIATPRDKEKSLWTKGSPSTLVNNNK